MVPNLLICAVLYAMQHCLNTAWMARVRRHFSGQDAGCTTVPQQPPLAAIDAAPTAMVEIQSSEKVSVRS